ncbi:hypothetical protein [Arthrobacter sp. CG_A4]|nr:hypothetical protein [Arthrobacter sp. CG_A4]
MGRRDTARANEGPHDPALARSGGPALARSGGPALARSDGPGR